MSASDAISGITYELIKIGVLMHRSLEQLSAPAGRVNRTWVDALHRDARLHIDNCRELSAQISPPQFRRDDDPDIGPALIENWLAMESAFSAPSLTGPELPLTGICLLLSRLFAAVHGALELCYHAASQASDHKPMDACRMLADELAPVVEHDEPYPHVEPYENSLGLFARISRTTDPIAELNYLATRASRGVFLREPDYRDEGPELAARVEPYLGPLEEIDIATGSRRGDIEITTATLRPEVLADAERQSDFSYPVWYATNRAPFQPLDPARGFSSTPDDRLHFGSCNVFVPRIHTTGSLGSSWFKRTWILRADDRLKIENGSFRARTQANFLASISAELEARKDGRTALVYVHGYNTTFEQAALTAAQIGCDLSVNGVTAFFSWPSSGNLLGYAKDGVSVGVSADHFQNFIEMLLEVHALERVDIVAHSMGNRLLAKVIKHFAESPKRKRIGHLVLAAPDVARIEFNPIREYYPAATSKRVSLYSSTRDLALIASTFIHQYTRIGYESPPYFYEGIDTISARHISLDTLGHGYFASSAPVIEDLKKLLWQDMAPSQRGLTPKPSLRMPEYWVLPNP